MSSTLNSTSTPLVASATWTGSVESCKSYSIIGVSLITDITCNLTINHKDKNGNLMSVDSFSCPKDIYFFKQVPCKATHFNLVVENPDVENNQATLRVVTKLANNAPDNMNVSLSSADTVTTLLATADGALNSVGGKLYVSQNVLVPANDGVLGYAYDGYGNNVSLQCTETGLLKSFCYGVNGLGQATALPIDGNGKLSVSHPQVSGSSYVTSNLKTSSQQASASAKQVTRMVAMNDSAQLRFIRIHDASSSPINTDAPVCVIAIKPNDVLMCDLGVSCASGVYITASSNWGTVSAFGSVNDDEVLCNLFMQ